MEKKEKRKNTKKILGKIFWTALIIFNIYVYLSIFTPVFKTQMKPLENEADYEIYSGRNVYEYWRGTLEPRLQTVYDEMKEACLQYKEKFYTKEKELTKQEIKKVNEAIELDYPEIYWKDSYSTINKFRDETKVNTNQQIALYYYFTKEETIEIKKRIEPKYQKIIVEAQKLETDYEKIKYVHDELINIGEYKDEWNKEDEAYFQSIISIFDTGETVCSGYSNAFKFIMDNLGINAISSWDISNEDVSENHQWNMVYLEGEWYNIDITWDAQTKKSGKDPYRYFLIYNEYFYTSHKKQEGTP